MTKIYRLSFKVETSKYIDATLTKRWSHRFLYKETFLLAFYLPTEIKKKKLPFPKRDRLVISINLLLTLLHKQFLNMDLVWTILIQSILALVGLYL